MKEKNKDKKKNENMKQEIIKLAVFAVCLLFLFNFVIRLGIIPSESMKPVVDVGDITVNNGLAYIGDNPERGDIVIFKDENGKMLIKRIIGMPNDVITFVDGYVVINGMVAEEEYIDSEIETNCADTFVVPEEHYFVLGDNRENSLDSRFFENPYISRSQIKGELLFVIKTSELINLFKTE